MDNSLITTSDKVTSGPWRSFARTTTSWLADYPFVLRAGGLGILVLLLSAPIRSDLWDLWSNRYGFSHGFLVPLISLYLAWLQWPMLRAARTTPAIGIGTLWVGTAALLLLASEVAGILTTGSVAFILLLAGLIVLLFGYAYLKALVLPLAYLIFMTPLLDIVTEPLEWPFQLLTANMSVSMLQTLGIPVLLENRIFIVLPTVTLEVARECSGAGLLIAVLAIALPLAFLTLQAWWRRIVLVLSSVLIAIVANWVRLTVMGVYAQAGGKSLHGPYHILQGLFVDWIAIGCLFVGAWLLSATEPAASIAMGPLKKESFRGGVALDQVSTRAWWLAGIMLAAATGALYSIDRGATGLLQDPKTFPFVIGTWTIDHQRDDELPVGLPDTDTSIVRSYRATDGRRVTLAVAYTKTQRQGKELVGLHTAPLHEKALPTVLQVGHQAPANRTIVEQGRRQIPAVFWYHIDGQSYADRSLTKLATIKQAFTRGRTDGALVMVFSNQQTNDREDTWKMQEDFAATVFPLLREYIP